MAISVLIVEDDRNIAELLQMYLEKEGYAVTVAADGGQGLAKYRAIKPDLVLLDVMMPVMDGWGVCKAIRAEAQTPIIMLTAKGETDDKVTGLKTGADDYITKPFEMKEVLARIEAVLRRTSGVAAEKKARRLVFEKLVIDMDAFELSVDGGKGLEKFRAIKPDLVLLDVMMPVMDGWTLCRTLRAESQTPIIMLTAKGETDDKVTGLKSGADDYITKPFEMKEVLARIEAVLRRTGNVSAEKKSRRLTFEKLIIDMDAFELIIDGKKVDTPPKEMELLFYLASSPNRVYTRNQLLDEVWGFDYFGDSRTVDVHVKRLREKLEVVSENWSLKTVWGVGYKFEVL